MSGLFLLSFCKGKNLLPQSKHFTKTLVYRKANSRSLKVSPLSEREENLLSESSPLIVKVSDCCRNCRQWCV